MAIVRAANHVEEYRARASLPDIAAMSSRPAETNREVAQAIVPVLGLSHNDVVADVGCGDGSLIRLIADSVRLAIGFNPTAEEIARLKAAYPSLDFREGLAECLPLADKSVSKLVCNGVIMALNSEENVAQALREFVRVTSTLVYIGEVPHVAVERTYDNSSVSAWLTSLFRNGGAKSFAAGIRDLCKAIAGKERLIFYPENWLWFAPEHFIEIASGCELELVEMRTTPHCAERTDYLFRV